ncbi:cytochrome P450 [Clathrospora elynae]|uniref:Cytochrome P450 n=1 Tax=Clathrospora elynae TaxID=706981 RepID=A0A6A5SS62_9PLEO|nr:cytochrome P450 [Clathrospora elynae]
MHVAVIASAAAVALVACIFFPFLKGLFSPLRTVPGPIAARFTDFWYLWRVKRGAFEVDNIELHRKHGEIVRYGPNRYSLSSPSAQKTIYGHGAKFPKSSWYKGWSNPHLDQWSVFSDQSIQRHSENRRQYQSAYTMSSLVSYESYVDECADLFSQRLQEVASAGVYADMGHWLQCYAFDVIGLITYSKRLGFLDRGEDISGVIAALEDHFQYATLVGVYPWFHKYIFPIRNWLAGPTGTGRAYVVKFTQDRIAEHQKDVRKGILVHGKEEEQTTTTTETTDFLTKFFRKNVADPQAFSMYHLAMGCVSNMVAGSDTTAITLSAILYYLLKNPRTFNALRHEIDSLQQDGVGKTSQFITFKESQDMPYLQAVLKEALRMHPATGLPLERVVPPGGATICDTFFPEGTIVGINSWVTHRNTAVFGPDANAFKPERWLSADKDKLSFMERSWMPVSLSSPLSFRPASSRCPQQSNMCPQQFGLGSRTCIGRHISFLEMSKLIPALVRDYDFELDNKAQARDWETMNHWFVKPRDFRVKVSVRPKSSG